MEVSVIVPVFQAEAFLHGCVNSILKVPEVREILLIDDGSTDQSLNICLYFAGCDSRVRVFQHPEGINRGRSATRNLGICLASCEYIAFLDADDRMTPTRFYADNTIFAARTSVDGVYGATGSFFHTPGSSNHAFPGQSQALLLVSPNKEIPSPFLFNFLIGFQNPNYYKGYFTIDALTIRRKSLLKAGIFFNESLHFHEDTVFIFQCAYKLTLFAGEIYSPVALRGIHDSNWFFRNELVRLRRLNMYSALIDWTNSSKIEKKYRWFFKQEFLLYKYLGNSVFRRGVSALLFLMRNPVAHSQIQKLLRRK